MDRRYLAVFSAIVILSIVIVVPIAITSAVIGKDKGEEYLLHRNVWSLVLSCEIRDVNRTSCCGFNYTDSVLVINVSLSAWDNHSHYEVYFGDPYAAGTHHIDVSPTHDCVRKIRLRTTSLINGIEVYRSYLFDNCTREYDVFLCERFSVEYKVLGFWHRVSFGEDTQIGVFSVSNGFNWE